MITAKELNVVASQAGEAKSYASELTERALFLAKGGVTSMLVSLQGRVADPVFCSLVMEHLGAAGYSLAIGGTHIEMTWGEKEGEV